MDNDRVQGRVQYLEEREKCLEKETHELREQNELLEFRILELEENQDKVSLLIIILIIIISYYYYYCWLKPHTKRLE